MHKKKFTINWKAFWPFKKKQNLWERFEPLWVVMISLTVVVTLSLVMRTVIQPPTVNEEIYISPSAFNYEAADFLVVEEEADKPELSNPLTLTSLLKDMDEFNPFVTLPALAENITGDSFTDQPSSLTTIVEPNLIDEPLIRVGLAPNLNPVVISNSENYEIKNFMGDPLITLSAGDKITLRYDYYQKLYIITQDEIEITSDNFLILKSLATDGLFTLHNYYNPPPWNENYADNVYRGDIEFIFTPATGRTWVINELPVEDYLKGLAETTAYAPLEYLKVMTVAARSYALWHEQEQIKYADEFYDVQANQNDQVYKGYLNELRHPNLSLAVAETRGLVATYDDHVAVIPYYAGSDGYTYSWQDVWGSNKYPWVIGTEVPEEIGYTRLGHGVGLSQRGALIKVKNGTTMEEVFKTFFPDIELTNIYAP